MPDQHDLPKGVGYFEQALCECSKALAENLDRAIEADDGMLICPDCETPYESVRMVQVSDLPAIRAAAVEKLRPFLQHKPLCGQKEICSCGLTSILATVDPDKGRMSDKRIEQARALVPNLVKRIEAAAVAEERERAKKALRAELEKHRFCNKCGYLGPLEAHEQETGCDYLASADLRPLAALDQEGGGDGA